MAVLLLYLHIVERESALVSLFSQKDTNPSITLSTKAHLVKAMVFPVVMYGWESWIIKKAER